MAEIKNISVESTPLTKEEAARILAELSQAAKEALATVETISSHEDICVADDRRGEGERPSKPTA